MSNRFLKSLSDSQFAVGAGRFQPGELGQARGHLPQVVERGQVDAPAVGQPARAGRPAARGCRARCGTSRSQMMASHARGWRLRRSSRSGAHASSTSNVMPGWRARASVDHLGQEVDALANARWAATPADRRAPQPTSSTVASAGISRASADCRSRSMKSRARRMARRLRAARRKYSRQAAASASDRDGGCHAHAPAASGRPRSAVVVTIDLAPHSGCSVSSVNDCLNFSPGAHADGLGAGRSADRAA